jgi:LPXTG-motif cell wall-anchored protein
MAALVSGCGPSAEQTAETADEQAKTARSEVERGPVRVLVEVDPAEARLSDEPTLTLTIDYQKEVTIQKPPFGESMGDFVIRDFREPLPKLQGDREIVEQVYTLEPTRTGQLSVWPISVTFTDTRPDGDGKEHTIETEGLTVDVESVVGSEIPSLAELRPAADPVELPQTGGRGLWWLAGLLLAAVAGVVAVVWYRRRRRSKVAEEEALSPRELAYLELERLLELGLAEQDVKLFYVELTAVVRRYIERTTGVLAPEQTTEEFLREISRKETFAPDERGRLKDFLEAADLVKFAAHQPRQEDLEASFERAKAFVGLEPMEVAA